MARELPCKVANALCCSQLGIFICPLCHLIYHQAANVGVKMTITNQVCIILCLSGNPQATTMSTTSIITNGPNIIPLFRPTYYRTDNIGVKMIIDKIGVTVTTIVTMIPLEMRKMIIDNIRVQMTTTNQICIL